MATLQQIYTARFEAITLRNKIVAAVIKAAQDVLNEDPATNKHQERKKWAKKAMNDPFDAAGKIHAQVCLVEAIAVAGDNASDADITNAVNGNINSQLD